MQKRKITAFVLGAFALAMPAAPGFAQARDKSARAGKATGYAKTSASRAVPAAGQANRDKGSRPGKKPGKNVVAGNTVVVNGGGGRGYYENGRYHDGHHDNDNDFLEFVGKTAAITAGASVVAAVIGSTTSKKPDGCQPVSAYGNNYMYCNGTYYQETGPTSQPTYTVVAPPQ